MGYRRLADYYDTVFDFGPAWGAQPREYVLGPILPRVRSACDIACGTGSTALWMAGLGIRTSALDLSPNMVRRARAKMKASGMHVPVQRADMRRFRLAEPVDLVTCEFDALNHVPKRSDLSQVVKCVSAALNPGGWFYFDVNTSLAFRSLWPTTWWIERPGVAFVMHGGYDAKHDRAWSDVELFERWGRLWKRTTERVEEVCWTDAEIRAALRQAGFAVVRSWDGNSLLEPPATPPPGCRTYYLARKRVGRKSL
jgi:SAM-dependent methyltransferase